jgi:hypothetical protein
MLSHFWLSGSTVWLFAPEVLRFFFGEAPHSTSISGTEASLSSASATV